MRSTHNPYDKNDIEEIRQFAERREAKDKELSMSPLSKARMAVEEEITLLENLFSELEQRLEFVRNKNKERADIGKSVGTVPESPRAPLTSWIYSLAYRVRTIRNAIVDLNSELET